MTQPLITKMSFDISYYTNSLCIPVVNVLVQQSSALNFKEMQSIESEDFIFIFKFRFRSSESLFFMMLVAYFHSFLPLISLLKSFRTLLNMAKHSQFFSLSSFFLSSSYTIFWHK